jgi:hypothetical protein
MRMKFTVGEQQAEFRFDSFTGRSSLTVDGEKVSLQSPSNPGAHVQIRTRTAWTQQVSGHDIERVRQRARLFGGFRASSFTATVDRVLVAEAQGY